MPANQIRLLIEKVGLPLVRLLFGSTPLGQAAHAVEATLGGAQVVRERRAARLAEELADRISEQLGELIEAQFGPAPDGNVRAAILAVGSTLSAGPLDTAQLIGANLDPLKLYGVLEERGKLHRERLLSDRAEGIFDALLREGSAIAVDLAVHIPDLQVRAFSELLSDRESLNRKFDEVLNNRPESVSKDSEEEARRFDRLYRTTLSSQFDYLEINGINLSPITQRYSLTTAYISLRGSSFSEEEEPDSRDAQPVETRLAEAGRKILVVGEAGHGKTTLLQWMAVSAARRSFPLSLASWNALVPFVFRVRSFAKGSLPDAELLTLAASESMTRYQPEGWVREILEARKGLILIDGLDEVSRDRQREILQWQRGLENMFPGNYFVITSRPSAARKNAAELASFTRLWLAEMEPAEIRAFIEYWHAAVSEALQTGQERAEFVSEAAPLARRVIREAPLRGLAANPLLCAVICALNWSKDGVLPERRMELYEQAITMLIASRDPARRIFIGKLGPPERRALLEALAKWMIANGESEVTSGRAVTHLRGVLKSLPHVTESAQQAITDLVERSGVIREVAPQRIGFLHRTFQEYLAAKAFVEEGSTPQVLRQTAEPEWQEVIVMAAGHSPLSGSDDLLTELLKKADSAALKERNALYILASRCLEACTWAPQAVTSQIHQFLYELIPPRSLDVVRSVVAVGTPAIPVLSRACENGEGKDPRPLQYSVEALTKIGGQEAMNALAELDPSVKAFTLDALVQGWSYFEPQDYALRVLRELPVSGAKRVKISDASLARHTGLVDKRVDFACVIRTPPEDIEQELAGSRLNSLTLTQAPEGVDFSFLGLVKGLTAFEVGGLRRFVFSMLELPAQDVTHLELSFADQGELDCRSLLAFPKLRVLRLSGDAVLRRLEDLKDLPHLTELRIEDAANLDADFPALRGLRALELRYFGGEDISFAAGSPALQELDLGGSPNVYDLSPLEAMTSLRFLDLSDCRSVTSLDAIDALELRELRIEGSGIRTEIDDSRTGLREAVGEDLPGDLGGLWNEEDLDHVEELPPVLLLDEGRELQAAGWSIITDLAAWERTIDLEAEHSNEPEF